MCVPIALNGVLEYKTRDCFINSRPNNIYLVSVRFRFSFLISHFSFLSGVHFFFVSLFVFFSFALYFDYSLWYSCCFWCVWLLEDNFEDNSDPKTFQGFHAEESFVVVYRLISSVIYLFMSRYFVCELLLSLLKGNKFVVFTFSWFFFPPFSYLFWNSSYIASLLCGL